MLTTDFVTSYIDAWNQHDPTGVAEHLAQDGTYCDIPAQRQLARDDLVAHLQYYFSRDSNRYSLVGDVLTGENSIAFQYRACCGKSDPGWMGAEFISMEGEIAGKIEDYYRDPQLAARGRSDSESSQRYAKSGLSADGLETVMMRLAQAMEEECAYLDSCLSLPGLAARLDCSINHLSQAINEGHRVSFFDFVNRYRVREATDILAAQEGKAPAILDVALAVGFNSTSTFYAAFKKTTGQTPAQFRRRAQCVI